MGSLSNESFDEFLDSLKEAGVVISNERELRERLAEVQRWRFAFATLASNGSRIGIRFEGRSAGVNVAEIHRAFAQYELPESLEAAFAAGLRVCTDLSSKRRFTAEDAEGAEEFKCFTKNALTVG